MVAGSWLSFRVTHNRPRCPVCAGQMKKNGTTTKGTTRWRCKNPDCGTSATRHRPDQTHTRDFKAFHAYVTGTASLTDMADTLNVSRRTLDRRFTSLWLIDVPNTPDPNRIYDQIFIDGIYTDAGKAIYALALKLTKTPPWPKHATGHYACTTSDRYSKHSSTRKRPCQKSAAHSINSGNGPTCESVRHTTHCYTYHATTGCLPTSNPHQKHSNQSAGHQQQTVWKAASTPGSNASLMPTAADPENVNAECSNGICTRKRNCLTTH